MIPRSIQQFHAVWIQRCDDRRPNAVARRIEEWRPVGATEELRRADILEELDRRLGERQDDADRDQDRHECCESEKEFDDLLDTEPTTGGARGTQGHHGRRGRSAKDGAHGLIIIRSTWS